MKEFLDVIVLLISFIGVLFIAYITTRFLGLKFSKYGCGKYLKIVDRIFLGKDKWICLVQIGKHYYIVGITSHNIELIGQIQEQDLTPLPSKREDSFFTNILGNYVRKQFMDGMDGHE